jgi:hypothetical protein
VAGKRVVDYKKNIREPATENQAVVETKGEETMRKRYDLLRAATLTDSQQMSPSRIGLSGN